MYCEQCGAKNEPGSSFCSACGAPLAAEQPAHDAAASSKPSVGASVFAGIGSLTSKKIKIAGAVIAAVLAIFVVSSLFGGRSDTETAEQFFDAIFEQDASALLDLVPKGVVQTVMDEGGYTKAEVAEELEELGNQFEYAVGSLDFLGRGVKISYEAVGSEHVGDNELDDIQEQYDQFNVNVSDAREVSVSFRVQASSLGIDEEAPFEVPVIKVGNSWYIDVVSLS